MGSLVSSLLSADLGTCQPPWLHEPISYYLPTYLPNLSIHLSVHTSIYLFIHSSTHLFDSFFFFFQRTLSNCSMYILWWLYKVSFWQCWTTFSRIFLPMCLRWATNTFCPRFRRSDHIAFVHCIGDGCRSTGYCCGSHSLLLSVGPLLVWSRSLQLFYLPQIFLWLPWHKSQLHG